MLLEIIESELFSEARLIAEHLDSANAADLKTCFVKLANNKPGVNLILNISNCNNYDTGGVSALLFGKRMIENSSGKMILTGVNENLKNILAISYLSEIFQIAKNTEEAQCVFLKASAQT